MHLDIEKLADEFFEWDGPRTPVVTFVSAKLFARHVAERALEEAAKSLEKDLAQREADDVDDLPQQGCVDLIRTLSRQITEGK